MYPFGRHVLYSIAYIQSVNGLGVCGLVTAVMDLCMDVLHVFCGNLFSWLHKSSINTFLDLTSLIF